MLRSGIAPGQHAQHRPRIRQRSRGSHIQQLASVHDGGSELEKGAEAPDRGQHRGDRQEVRWRGVDGVATGGEVVPQLVHQQDAEQRDGEGPPAEDDVRRLSEEIGEEPQAGAQHTGETAADGGVVATRQGGPGGQRADGRHGEQGDMQQPPFPPRRREGPDQNQLRVIGAGPVVDVGPGRQRLADGDRGSAVFRGHQALDDFSGAGTNHPPGIEAIDQCVHGRP